MANSPKTDSSVIAPVAPVAPAGQSALDKVMAALAVQPQAKESALLAMVRAVCVKNGQDYDKMTAGNKAAITRRVKAAAESAGVTL